MQYNRTPGLMGGLFAREGQVGYRAILNTDPATGAQVHINAPRPFPDLYLEIPW
jgi:hypothetical protein